MAKKKHKIDLEAVLRRIYETHHRDPHVEFEGLVEALGEIAIVRSARSHRDGPDTVITHPEDGEDTYINMILWQTPFPEGLVGIVLIPLDNGSHEAN